MCIRDSAALLEQLLIDRVDKRAAAQRQHHRLSGFHLAHPLANGFPLDVAEFLLATLVENCLLYTSRCV